MFKILGGIVCGVAFATAALAADPTFKWRAETLLNADAGEVENFKWFADKVKERTKGRMEITIYPGGALNIPVTELYRSLKAGVVEMSMGFSEFQAGDAPALSLDSRFYLWNKAERWAMHESLKPLRTRILAEDWGVVLLDGFPLYNTLDGIVSNVPGNTWADFKGKKIRVSAPDSRRVYELNGVSGVFMPLAETYQALKTGVIDGIDTSPRSVVERSLYEVAKHYVNVGYPGSVMWTCELYVSKRHWDKLPADIKTIMQETAQETARRGLAISNDPRTENVYLDKMRANGMTISYFPEAELEKSRQAAATALLEFMKDKQDRPRLVQVFDMIKPQMPQPGK
ncbi:MAG: TRAP transporter substrate-binding protein DctP [Bryobacteraceae bacterium]